MNAVKDMLRAGQTAVGTSPSPDQEIGFLADAGFDFLLFDTQHSPVEIKALGPSLASMRRRKATPILSLIHI